MIRLLDDRPLPGPGNMARDEALMQAVGAGDSLPTLRLYQWIEPTVSLGYFQKFTEFEALESPARDLAVVRRPTGGGAILHDLELTYSIALTTDHELVAKGATRLYELAHDAIIAALRPLNVIANRCGASDDSGPAKGPFFCFARRHCPDILLDGQKLAGSAQRRTRRAVLQHGSIILANRFPQQPTAALPVPFDEALAHLRTVLPQEFVRATGMSISQAEWTASELASAAELIPKYSGPEWTRRV